MTQSYNAQRQRFGEEHEIFVTVTSKNCSYQVTFRGDDIWLQGPGVNEHTEGDSFPPFESFEDFAIHIVLLFENGLWPED